MVYAEEGSIINHRKKRSRGSKKGRRARASSSKANGARMATACGELSHVPPTSPRPPSRENVRDPLPCQPMPEEVEAETDSLRSNCDAVVHRVRSGSLDRDDIVDETDRRGQHTTNFAALTTTTTTTAATSMGGGSSSPPPPTTTIKVRRRIRKERERTRSVQPSSAD